MTIDTLQEILQSEDTLTLKKVEQIIYELKNDCCVFKENAYEAGFYNGQMNAFYICLDLLDKVEDRFDILGLRRRFELLAGAVDVDETADPREILDEALKRLSGIKEKDKNESWKEDARRRGEKC